mmetsp:Transcript_77662/g.220098  ORF Transcript_77662/g.220098 Transcript_77662/m.220098 type:complete len:211 (-) Transcript_77662:233-865(-)
MASSSATILSCFSFSAPGAGGGGSAVPSGGMASCSASASGERPKALSSAPDSTPPASTAAARLFSSPARSSAARSAGAAGAPDGGGLFSASSFASAAARNCSAMYANGLPGFWSTTVCSNARTKAISSWASRYSFADAAAAWNCTSWSPPAMGPSLDGSVTASALAFPFSPRISASTRGGGGWPPLPGPRTQKWTRALPPSLPAPFISTA